MYNGVGLALCLTETKLFRFHRKIKNGAGRQFKRITSGSATVQSDIVLYCQMLWTSYLTEYVND